ncbi:MAG: hypothetical protein H0V70_00070 [Ktedonobacteraceae bacterium]|nr:hypothetical protein [Ktedonobacteraceae bacterium]
MKLRHLSHRLIIAVLLFGLCVTGTLISLNHARSVSAAPAPYFTVTVGGQKYAAQYAGGGSSSYNSRSASSNFGKWNEYIIDSSGKGHFWGQFSGTDAAYFDSHGKVVGGVNVNVPGIGHIDTYAHEQTLGPDLPALRYPYESPSQYTLKGTTVEHETYLGTRVAQQSFASRRGGAGVNAIDCQVDAGNLDYGHLGWQADNVEMTTAQPFSTEDSDCIRGQTYLQEGDAAITNFYNQFVPRATTMPNVNAPVVASLDRPSLPIPVILGIAGGVFFIASVVSGNICNFVSCSNTAKKVLAAVALGMGIISGVLGITSGILTALRAFATASPALAAGLGAEAAGAVEMTGAAGSPTLARNALNEALVIGSTTITRSVSFP